MKLHWYCNNHKDAVAYFSGAKMFAEIRRHSKNKNWYALIFKVPYEYDMDSYKYEVKNGIPDRLGPFKRRYQAKRAVETKVHRYLLNS